jgi:hypothetical protein
MNIWIALLCMLNIIYYFYCVRSGSQNEGAVAGVVFAGTADSPLRSRQPFDPQTLAKAIPSRAGWPGAG